MFSLQRTLNIIIIKLVVLFMFAVIGCHLFKVLCYYVDILWLYSLILLVHNLFQFPFCMAQSWNLNKSLFMITYIAKTCVQYIQMSYFCLETTSVHWWKKYSFELLLLWSKGEINSWCILTHVVFTGISRA